MFISFPFTTGTQHWPKGHDYPVSTFRQIHGLQLFFLFHGLSLIDFESREIGPEMWWNNEWTWRFCTITLRHGPRPSCSSSRYSLDVVAPLWTGCARFPDCCFTSSYAKGHKDQKKVRLIILGCQETFFSRPKYYIRSHFCFILSITSYSNVAVN